MNDDGGMVRDLFFVFDHRLYPGKQWLNGNNCFYCTTGYRTNNLVNCQAARCSERLDTKHWLFLFGKERFFKEPIKDDLNIRQLLPFMAK